MGISIVAAYIISTADTAINNFFLFLFRFTSISILSSNRCDKLRSFMRALDFLMISSPSCAIKYNF